MTPEIKNALWKVWAEASGLLESGITFDAAITDGLVALKASLDPYFLGNPQDEPKPFEEAQ